MDDNWSPLYFFTLATTINQTVSAYLLCIVWIMAAFQWERTQLRMYISYPVSWGLTASVYLTSFLVRQKRCMPARRLDERLLILWLIW